MSVKMRSQNELLGQKPIGVLMGLKTLQQEKDVGLNKKSLSSFDDRLYIRFSAASYSPTKLPWQYHRR